MRLHGLDKARAGSGRYQKAFDVPNSCALLGGLAEEEANLLEGLCEGEFGGHFFEGEKERGGERGGDSIEEV